MFKQLIHRRQSKVEENFDREIDSITRVLEDEAYQNTMLAPELAVKVASSEGVDQLLGASGDFGYDLSNPIPVNGPLGAITYLSRLKTRDGNRLLSQRVGVNDKVQAFEAVTYDGREWFLLFFDICHPRKSKLLPNGFDFAGDIAMFCGFNDDSAGFPEDFKQRTERLEAAIRPAYAPDTRFSGYFERDLYSRPLDHWAKLEAIAARGLL